MDFENWLSANGFDVATVDDKQRLVLQAAWRASLAGDRQPVEPTASTTTTAEHDLDKVLGKYRAEQHRENRITRLVAEAVETNPGRIDDFEKIGRSAIAGKWSEQETELALLRAGRPTGPAPLGGGRSSAPPSQLVLEAAFAQATGLQSAESSYDERTLESAWKQFRGGMSLLQLIQLSAQSNGYRSSVPVKNNLKSALEYAFNPRSDSAVSTISVSGILSNVANKYVKEAFNGVERSWDKISARRNVSDFKAISSYAMSGDSIFEEISPSGEIKHGTLSETGYTNQAKSFGKMLGLSRTDMINDDAGAFTTINKKLGRGGALKLNLVFWKKFLANSAFFTTGNKNLLTGAGSALSLTGLEAADTAFRLLKDPDGNLMGGMPKFLVVPTAKRVTASNLMASTTTVATTTANTPLPDGNPFEGMFEVVSSAYLQDTTLTGNSATGWYLLADPNDVPVIEIAFLNGQEAPTIESADADFSQLGVQFRGYWDFGVELQEFRGGVKSAGV